MLAKLRLCKRMARIFGPICLDLFQEMIGGCIWDEKQSQLYLPSRILGERQLAQCSFFDFQAGRPPSPSPDAKMNSVLALSPIWRARAFCLQSWACGAAGSARPWHRRGRRFDPHRPYQYLLTNSPSVALGILGCSRVGSETVWRLGVTTCCMKLTLNPDP